MRKKIGIDIGSRFIRIIFPDEQTPDVIEPSVVAINEKGKVAACGEDAISLSRRLPGSVKLVYPFSGLSSPEPAVTKAVFSWIVKGMRIRGYDVFFSIAGEQDDETEQTIVESAQKAGLKDVLAIDAAYAAAVGCGVSGATESAIVNIGASITDIAVFSHGKLIASDRCEFSGDNFDRTVEAYLFRKHQCTAEQSEIRRAKSEAGTLTPGRELSCEITTMHSPSGLPKKITLTEGEMCSCFEPVFDELVDRIMSIIRALSAEPDKIILTGGGAKLHGLDQALAPLLCLPVEVCRDSENAVIRGIAKLMSDKKKKK